MWSDSLAFIINLLKLIMSAIVDNVHSIYSVFLEDMTFQEPLTITSVTYVRCSEEQAAKTYGTLYPVLAFK